MARCDKTQRIIEKQIPIVLVLIAWL